MFKYFILVTVAAVVAAQEKYPAGLNPALCPDYPFCSALVLSAHISSAKPLPYPWAQYPWTYYPGLYHHQPSATIPGVGAPVYPLGIDPALCPNYPFCDVTRPPLYTAAGLPVPQWGWVPGLFSPPVPENPPAPAESVGPPAEKDC